MSNDSFAYATPREVYTPNTYNCKRTRCIKRVTCIVILPTCMSMHIARYYTSRTIAIRSIDFSRCTVSKITFLSPTIMPLA